MTTAEFEEKEFESPLINQLISGGHHLWSPGQVFEHHIGIDQALFVSNPVFWNLVGYHFPPIGVFLPKYEWRYIWRKRRRRRTLPNFRLNLFLQCKRPETSRYPLRKHTQKGIRNRIWRFTINLHQQSVLEQVDARLNQRALVSYAAPVFHRIRDLFEHTEKGSIVQNSTFPPVVTLRNHGSWVYQVPGANGWAFTEPEFVESQSLSSRIAEILETISENNNAVDDNAEKDLFTLAEQIYSAVAETRQTRNPRTTEFLKRVSQIRKYVSRDEFASMNAFSTVLTFCDVFNLGWLVIGRE